MMIKLKTWAVDNEIKRDELAKALDVTNTTISTVYFKQYYIKDNIVYKKIKDIDAEIKELLQQKQNNS